MKAKDYAKKYKELKELQGEEEALAQVLLLFLDECHELVEKRKCFTNSAYGTVFKEQNQKWLSFAAQTKEVAWVFQEAVKRTAPAVYALLVRDKVFLRRCEDEQ